MRTATLIGMGWALASVPFGLIICQILKRSGKDAEQDPMTKHIMVLKTVHQRGPRYQYRGLCSCGATSPLMDAAGFCHGWHARHLDDVGGWDHVVAATP